jgi:hypothetical protein
MIRRGLLVTLCGGLIGLNFAGCGGSPEGSDVVLAQAEGVVMYKGSPFAGATVTFIPEKGPVAMGTTDLQGKFKLSSGTVAGVAVGKAKATVSAVEAGKGIDTEAPVSASMKKPSSPEEMKKRLEAIDPSRKFEKVMDAGGVGQTKSLINPKYADPGKSGFDFTIDKDSAKNKFTLEVTE